jgi:hypothetical protein
VVEASPLTAMQKEKAHRGGQPVGFFVYVKIKNAPSSQKKRQGILK